MSSYSVMKNLYPKLTLDFIGNKQEVLIFALNLHE